MPVLSTTCPYNHSPYESPPPPPNHHHSSWQGQLRRCVSVGAHRHVQLWHVRWSLAVCTYTGVRVLSAVSAKPATVSPLSSSAHTVRGAAVLHASCPLFFDEQLVLCNSMPNSPAWQVAVYFLPRDMLRTLNCI